LSANGDPLEVLEAAVDFEDFRGWLVERLGYRVGAKGESSPLDPVSMFKSQIQNVLSGFIHLRGAG
jgi:hypothetical protein